MGGWDEAEIKCSRIINRKFPYVLRSSIKNSLDTIVILGRLTRGDFFQSLYPSLPNNAASQRKSAEVEE